MKLVTTTEADCDTLLAWINTQKGYPTQDGKTTTWDFVRPRYNTSMEVTGYYIAKPDIDCSGSGVSYTEEEWHQSWTGTVEAETKKLQIYNYINHRQYSSGDVDGIPVNPPLKELDLITDEILSGGKPESITYYDSYDFDTETYLKPVYKDSFTYTVQGVFKKRVKVRTFYYTDGTECPNTITLKEKPYKSSDGSEFRGKRAINTMRNNILMDTQMNVIGYIVGVNVIEISDAITLAKDFSTHFEPEFALYRDGTVDNLVSGVTDFNVTTYPEHDWLDKEIASGLTCRQQILNEIGV